MNKINQEQINIGNESAIDLVVAQNKAKEELAGNLQGLGITDANATTNTLEELVYKTSLVNADTLRQKPKGIAINSEYVCDGNYSGSVGYFTIKNGFLFWRYPSSTRYILYKKLATIKSNITSYNNAVNILSSGTTTRVDLGSSGSTYTTTDVRELPTFVFNNDGTNLYVMNNSTVKKYSVSGYDGTTITISLTATYTPQFNSSGISLNSIDINDAETKMIVQDTNGDIGIFDLTGATTQNLTILTNTSNATVAFLNNSDGDIAIATVDTDNNILTIYIYSVSNDTISLLDTISNNISNATQYRVGFTKYKVGTNDYRLFFHNGGLDLKTPSFTMINGSTKAFITIYTSYNVNDSFIHDDYNPNSDCCSPININIVGNYFYVMAGMNLVVFDSNWNMVGNIINRINTNTKYFFRYTYIYDGDFYEMGQDNNVLKGMKHRAWFDKLIAYERTVTVTKDGQTIERQVPYFAQLTETDLDDGFYNI